MNLKISSLLVVAAALTLGSCSSVYKSGQTPDDVYYSPGRTGAAYASGNDDNGSDYLATNQRRRYNDRVTDPNYADDQYMRMAIATGRRPMFFDDFAMMNPYYRNNWAFNSWMVWNSPWNSPWNSMYMWNSFYNPYWGIGNGWYGGGFGLGWSPGWGSGWGPGWGGGHWAGGGIINKPGYYTAPRPSRPRSGFTMGSYLNNNNRNSYRVNNSYYGNYNNRNSYNDNRSFNNSNNRSMYNNNRSTNSGSFDRPTRSYSPSSSPAGGSRGSSGGGGGVSRPTRSGN
jgi:hypothetical protein